MIIFAPAYDSPTNSNHAVALMIKRPTDTFLGAKMATRNALLATLSTCDKPLMLLTHGDVDKVFQQKGVAALTEGDLRLFPQRHIFAQACYTAISLGKKASELGFFWWGYQVLATAPSDSPEEVLALFQDIFIFIRDRFSQAKSKVDCENLFKDLHDLCDKTNNALDDLGDLSSPDSYMCVKNLQNDLLVWIPGVGPLASPHRRGRPEIFV